MHLAEQRYATIQKDGGPWEPTEMLQDLAGISGTLHYYLKISEEKLGRRNNNNFEITRAVVESWYTDIIDGTITHPDLEHHFRGSLRKMQRLLYVPCHEVINEALEVLPVLAKDLRKVEPEYLISGENPWLTPKGNELLNNILVHLIRNSMDHGLEGKEERISSGKKQKGSIKISLSTKEGFLEILFEDDGRGLDLDKIAKLARTRDLAIGNADSAIDIANLIFNPGFSTSNTVTNISGRGVGMDAVRRYLNELGGNIEIRLASNQSQGRVGFHFIITIPDNLVSNDLA